VNATTSARKRATSSSETRPAKGSDASAPIYSTNDLPALYDVISTQLEKLRRIDDDVTGGFTIRICIIARHAFAAFLKNRDSWPVAVQAERLFDIEALLMGAQTCEAIGQERYALLDTALRAIDRATDVLMEHPDYKTADTVADESIYGQPKPARDAARNVERAACILNTIAGIAATIERFGVQLVSASGEDSRPNEVEALSCGVRDLSAQIGLLADFAMEEMGSASVTRGGIREWLLPPVYGKTSNTETGGNGMNTPRTTRLSAEAAESIRTNALTLARQALNGMLAAEDAGETGDNVARVLRHAERLLDAWVREVDASTLHTWSAHAWSDRLHDIDSMVLCAIAYESAHANDSPRLAVLDGSVRVPLLDILQSLDRIDLPQADQGDYERHSFMRGKQMVCDLLDEIASEAASDQFDMWAKHRGRDVPQRNVVHEFLEQIRFDEGALAGIGATLTGMIGMTMNGSLPESDQIRNATYEDCFGTPDMMYMGEPGFDGDAGSSMQPEDSSKDEASSEWRAKVRELVEKVSDIAGHAINAFDLQDGDAVFAELLLQTAMFLAEDHTGILDKEPGEVRREFINKLEACFMGARNMPDVPEVVFAAALQPAIDLLNEAWDVTEREESRLHAEARQQDAARERDQRRERVEGGNGSHHDNMLYTVDVVQDAMDAFAQLGPQQSQAIGPSRELSIIARAKADVGRHGDAMEHLHQIYAMASKIECTSEEQAQRLGDILDALAPIEKYFAEVEKKHLEKETREQFAREVSNFLKRLRGGRADEKLTAAELAIAEMSRATILSAIGDDDVSLEVLRVQFERIKALAGPLRDERQKDGTPIPGAQESEHR
jgi:hypothetical protein